jgi:D-alanyl-D-alanine carboxypeptidase/D-alanyl-D-alanine-endopeptidase (penicillin-binding protein 4)
VGAKTDVRVLGADDAGAPLPTTAGLAALLDGIVTSRTIGGDASAAVVDANSGRLLYGYRADEAMPPASTDKIATAVTVLERLPATQRLVTSVVEESGRIILVGGGDVTLSTNGESPDPDLHPASLQALADQTAAVLKGRGARSVQLGYDASIFAGPSLARSWSAASVEGSTAPLRGLEVDEWRLVPQREFSSRYQDPAKAAAEVFARALEAAGIAVIGPIAETAAPSGAVRIASVQSPPMTDLVEHMLMVSDDDLAEALGHLAARAAGAPATYDGATAVTLDTLRRLGVDTDGMQLLDSSGLSHQDRTSAATLAAMLAAAAAPAHPRLRTVLTGLPIAGFTGTLEKGRFTAASTNGIGVVRAKTGTLNGVATEAGLLEDADGRLLTYAVMADKASNAAVTQTQLDRFAATLVSCGCR